MTAGQSATGVMPALDWLTGLASRDAFSRQVDQADRDRDRFAIAVIAIDHFADVNRQLGYNAADDLLRVLGRVLAEQSSVAAVAGRLGGAKFGLLKLQILDRPIEGWLEPIVASLRTAIGTWTFDQIDDSGGCAVRPELLVGAAAGCSCQVWQEAELALQVAADDPLGRPVVEFVPDDPSFVELGRRQRIGEEVSAALRAGSLSAAASRVEPIGGGGPDWQWLRLEARVPSPDRPAATAVTAALGTTLSPGLARQVERWLLEEAEAMLAGASCQLRLTVPLGQRLTSGRPLAERLIPDLERCGIPPSRLLFEVDETILVDSGRRARELGRQLEAVGSGLVVADSDGSWRAWRAVEGLAALYVRPHRELVEAAASGGPADRILDAMAANAEAADRELIAPACCVPERALADHGFGYVERGLVADAWSLTAPRHDPAEPA